MISIGILLLTVVFAVLALLGVYSSYRERKSGTNKVAYWHSALGSLTHLVVTVYLLSFGVIGLMTWAWSMGHFRQRLYSVMDP